MRTIEAPCKICGRPAVAAFDNDASHEAVDKWLPMLTHDTCVDLHFKRRDAEETIIETCFVYARMNVTEKGKTIAKLRFILLNATKRYAEALAVISRAPSVLYSDDFTATLLENPDKVCVILRRYRDEVRRLARA